MDHALIPDRSYRAPLGDFTHTVMRRAVVEASSPDAVRAVISLVYVEIGGQATLFPYVIESAYGRQTRSSMAAANECFDAEVSRLYGRI